MQIYHDLYAGVTSATIVGFLRLTGVTVPYAHPKPSEAACIVPAPQAYDRLSAALCVAFPRPCVDEGAFRDLLGCLDRVDMPRH